MWAHASIEIVSRGFYALSDTRTPVAVAVAAMLLNVALCAALVAPFGIAGLAAAASLAAVVEFALLLRALRRRLRRPRARLREAAGLGGSVLRTAGATVVMAQVVVLLLILLRAAGASPQELLGALVLVLFGGTGGLLAFLAAAALLHSAEYRCGGGCRGGLARVARRAGRGRLSRGRRGARAGWYTDGAPHTTRAPTKSAAHGRRDV